MLSVIQSGEILRMTKYEIASIGVVTVTALILIIQTSVIAYSVKADHRRRKKQITIERLGPLVRSLKSEMEAKEPIVDQILEALEHECAGINMDVYDLDIFFQMFGPTLPEMYEKLVPHVEAEKTSDRGAYTELEKVVNEFVKRLRVHPLSKDVWHSRPFPKHNEEIV